MDMLYDKYLEARDGATRFVGMVRALQRPLSRDVGQMDRLWRACSGEQRDTAIAVMLRIFSPRTLLSGRSVERGVVRPLSVVSGLSRTHVSKLCHDIHFRYRTQPRLRERVEQIAEKIFTQ